MALYSVLWQSFHWGHMFSQDEVASVVYYVPGCFFFFFCFLGPHPWYKMFPGWGSNQSCNCWPTPQPQQHRIWATSATYTTAHGNAGSSTHWARPRIEPATSWMLVRFANHWPTTGTPVPVFYLFFFSLIASQNI